MNQNTNDPLSQPGDCYAVQFDVTIRTDESVTDVEVGLMEFGLIQILKFQRIDDDGKAGDWQVQGFASPGEGEASFVPCLYRLVVEVSHLPFWPAEQQLAKAFAAIDDVVELVACEVWADVM